MRSLHEIREKLYDEMKRMTPEEHTVPVNNEAEELTKKYRLKMSAPLAASAKQRIPFQS